MRRKGFFLPDIAGLVILIAVVAVLFLLLAFCAVPDKGGPEKLRRTISSGCQVITEPGNMDQQVRYEQHRRMQRMMLRPPEEIFNPYFGPVVPK